MNVCVTLVTLTPPRAVFVNECDVTLCARSLKNAVYCALSLVGVALVLRVVRALLRVWENCVCHVLDAMSGALRP